MLEGICRFKIFVEQSLSVCLHNRVYSLVRAYDSEIHIIPLAQVPRRCTACVE